MTVTRDTLNVITNKEETIAQLIADGGRVDKHKNVYDEVNIKHNKKGLTQFWLPNFAGPIQIYWLVLS